VNRQGAGQPGPLLHPAGKLIGKVVLEPPQADHVDVVIDPLLDLGLGHFLDVKVVGDVLMEPFPGEQAEVLEDHGDLGPGAVHSMAVDSDPAPFEGIEAVDGLQQRCFSATAGSEDADDLFGPDIQGEVLKGHHGADEKALRRAFDANFVWFAVMVFPPRRCGITLSVTPFRPFPLSPPPRVSG